MRSPEGVEKDAIKKYLTANGFWFFSPSMTGFGGSGVPDLVGCKDSKFFAIEVKRPGKAPTPIQQRRMAEIQKHGGLAVAGDAPAVIMQLKALFPNG